MALEWKRDAFAAGRRGDPLGVLAATHGTKDPMALVLRATALGQLGELQEARELARHGARGFEREGNGVDALRARLVEAELAVWDLDLSYGRTALIELAHELGREGDHVNAAWARVTAARAAHLQGDAEGAELLLVRCREEASGRVPGHVAAVLALAEGEHFARTLSAQRAHEALARARALVAAGDTVLSREVERFARELAAPAARVEGRDLDLSQVARVAGSAASLVVDACRARISLAGRTVVDLATRPVLFDLAVAIARAAPAPVAADVVVREAFGARVPNESHAIRLRVELGRLRAALGDRVGRIVSERRQLRWESPLPVVVLEPLVRREEARVRAVLADGRAWPARALAEVLGQSARTVQRMLAALEEEGAVLPMGRGRAQRWVAAEAAPRIASWMVTGSAPVVGVPS